MYYHKHITDAKKHEGSIFLKFRLRMRRGRSLSRVIDGSERSLLTPPFLSYSLSNAPLMHLIPYLFWVHQDPLGHLIAMVDLVSLVAWVARNFDPSTINSCGVFNLIFVITFHTYSSHSLRWIRHLFEDVFKYISNCTKNPHVLPKNMFLAHNSF